MVLKRPGLTPEEAKAAAASLAILLDNGYQGTTVRLSIDAAGVRASHPHGGPVRRRWGGDG